MHMNSVFQLSTGIKVTCNSGLAGRYTWGIFKSCVLLHKGYDYIWSFEFPLCHYCESKVFEMASRF